jgi:hypothetical protein
MYNVNKLRAAKRAEKANIAAQPKVGKGGEA